MDYILEKLYLKEGMSLLDIGCGWGFLLIEAARKYKIKGTGITLSHEQYDEFKRRIEAEGLQDSLTVELMDYRDLPKYGKEVRPGCQRRHGRTRGTGKLPAVYRLRQRRAQGRRRIPAPFYQRSQGKSGRCVDKKYIFPGGVVPSLREMISAMGDDNFHVLDVENLRLHYNKTLLCWEENYKEHIDQVREMFDERFVRMWDLYLSACAATFHNGIIDLHQILVTKG